MSLKYTPGFGRPRWVSRPLHGPQSMNILQPLLRASHVAEDSLKKAPKRPFSSYYPFPSIPRPKRNVLYYQTWTQGVKMPQKTPLGLPNIAGANLKLKSLTQRLHRRFFSTEARKKRQDRRRFVRWWTVTSLTVVLGGVAAKIRYERGQNDYENAPFSAYAIKPQLWHLYAYSTLPLKAISRLWGQVNLVNLPLWMRSPAFRLYLMIFGVNLDEMNEPDLTTYSNLLEFFYRTLRPGVRPLSKSDLVSPSDGTVLKFGVIDNGEIEQVKGMTYSIDALLGINSDRLAAPTHSLDFENVDEAAVLKRDEEFAKINGISYLVDDLVGGDSASTFHMNTLHYKDKGDGTAKGEELTYAKELLVAKNLAPTPLEQLRISSHKQLYFAVIYLAPGDYHRYHSPTNWVTTLRRHFIGELFLVAPFFQKTLQGLFVLNERVALLGYWKYGFFSMIPVGATNVGSIVVNFDKDLKTNDVYENAAYATSDESTPLLGASSGVSSASSRPKKLRKNTVYEATYTKASPLLGGYPLTKGQEVGGFKLGLTVVLVFEAPNNFRFNLEQGQTIRMGELLGDIAEIES